MQTRLTQMFDIEHPILSAPMAFAAGGMLAAEVSRPAATGRPDIEHGEIGRWT